MFSIIFFVLILAIVAIVLAITLLFGYNCYNTQKYPQNDNEKQVEKIHTRVVNLNRSPDRLKRIKTMLRDNNYERFQAIDGNDDLSKHIEHFNVPNTRAITDYELACTFSHLRLMEELASDENNWAMIVLEDDIILRVPSLPSSKAVWERCYGILPEATDIVMLSNSWLQTIFIPSMPGFANYQPISVGFGTMGMLVTKTGAEKILKNVNGNVISRRPIDLMIHDMHYHKLVNIYKLRDEIVSDTDDFKSTIPKSISAQKIDK